MNYYKDYIRTDGGEVYAEIKYSFFADNESESGKEYCRIEYTEVDCQVYDEHETEWVLKADMEWLQKTLMKDFKDKQSTAWEMEY